MPLSAKDVESSSYLRLLEMGGPKVGKTRTTIATCHLPAYVINCDDKFALKPATQATTNFEWDLVTGDDASLLSKMERAIGEARKGVKEGRYKTIIWDTMTYYAMRLEQVLADATNNAAGEPDGRRYWPRYEKELRGIVDRLFSLDAHVIILAHYLDVKGAPIADKMSGTQQLEKSGDGICPLLGGKARITIPAMCQDVVFMEMRGGKRIFTTSSEGVWGPGCRNLDGVSQVDADIKVLWETMQKKKQDTNTDQTKKDKVSK